MEQSTLEKLEEQYFSTLIKLDTTLPDEDGDDSEQRALIKKLDVLYEQYMGHKKLELEREKLQNERIDNELKHSEKDRELELKRKEQLHQEFQDQRDREIRNRELDLKEEQLHQAKIDRIANVATTVITVGVPATFASVWMKRGLKFEESGTYTSRSGNVISNTLKLFGKK